MSYFKGVLKLGWSIFIIILIGSIPFLFNGYGIDFSNYIKGVNQLLTSIVNGDIYYHSINTTPRELFPDIWSPYFFSLKMLISAVIVSIILSIATVYLVSLFSRDIRRKSNLLFFVAESIPDIFIVVSIQSLVIWFFKKTDILLFSVASGYEEQAFGIPFLTLCILPTFLISRIMLQRFNEEREKEYYHFAISKGLSKNEVMLKHILPNTMLHLLSHSKYIVWLILSNLVMVEYIFNINGLTSFIIRFNSTEVFTVCIILIFLPVILGLKIVDALIYRWRGEPY
ncbi:ABC transporter permease subunit [Rossellomorea vietnamensis]|uniref:ABC transporter permease subunit n=1 Tax=Rossellomorea vietnamensis TaxID=218284 RepID=A0A5D4P0W1_9BACI|nr:ABC transporter permease subunit [Rossellomorea vietnamensis]TYS19860.1 ABC transporter permease subunit [Rossellomorea vietnamensis]